MTSSHLHLFHSKLPHHRVKMYWPYLQAALHVLALLLAGQHPLHGHPLANPVDPSGPVPDKLAPPQQLCIAEGGAPFQVHQPPEDHHGLPLHSYFCTIQKLSILIACVSKILLPAMVSLTSDSEIVSSHQHSGPPLHFPHGALLQYSNQVQGHGERAHFQTQLPPPKILGVFPTQYVWSPPSPWPPPDGHWSAPSHGHPLAPPQQLCIAEGGASFQGTNLKTQCFSQLIPFVQQPPQDSGGHPLPTRSRPPDKLSSRGVQTNPHQQHTGAPFQASATSYSPPEPTSNSAPAPALHSPHLQLPKIRRTNPPDKLSSSVSSSPSGFSCSSSTPTSLDPVFHSCQQT